jgi:alpha-beta hydrolase superfamily lysophospholipase
VLNKGVMILLSCIIVGIAAIWIAGGQLSTPAMVDVGSPPPNEPFASVELDHIHGWYLSGKENRSCILLMHGVRSNRREMLGRAIFLRNAGYSTFAIDLQAHGESIGTKITFGYREAESARRAVAFLRQHKACKSIIALGSSLGGAAALLGDKPLNVEGFILEAVYTNVKVAVRNRLRSRAGEIGSYFAPLLYEQIPLRLGIELSELQPAEAIKRIKAPVLIMNGTEDMRTTRADAIQLYENAPEPKRLLWFEQAGHTNLFEYDRIKYSKAVLEFLHWLDEKHT